MRRVSRLAIGTVAVAALVVVGAAPAAAHYDPKNLNHTHGGSTGHAIWVTAGASGGAKKSYPSCPWQAGWPGGTGPSEVITLPSILQMVLGAWGYPFGDPDVTATVELVPASEADLDGDGEIDDDFVVPILADEDDYVIGETEGLNWLEELVVNVLGTHDLGVFEPDPLADLDPDTLTEGELDGSRYRENGSFPLIQRGEDPLTGDDLWWDPWFVAIEDQTADCPAGVYYSPRTTNPAILIPDLTAMAIDLLPPASPIVVPRDLDDDWAYVQVPTNFAVTASSLQRPSVHAEVPIVVAPGVVDVLWADMVAVPTLLVFDPGDDTEEPVVCHISEMGYTVTDPGDCSYTYFDSSDIAPGDAFRAQVSVMWVGFYTDSTGVSNTINLPPTTASFDLQVAEARPSS